MYAPQGPFTNLTFAAVGAGKALLVRGNKVQEKGVQKPTPCGWSTELTAVASLQFPGRRGETSQCTANGKGLGKKVSTVIYTTVASQVP